MTYTNDKDKWYNLEHDLTGHCIMALREGLGIKGYGPYLDNAEKFLEEMYTEMLEYWRGLEQDTLIKMVQEIAPAMLDTVKEEDV